MKNQYSKFVKYLVKRDNIYFQRVDKSVYLSNGKVVLMVPAPVCAAEIRPLSGLLPDTTGDCTGVKRSDDFRKIEKLYRCMVSAKEVTRYEH